MQAVVRRGDLVRALSHCQGISDRKSTMPILANVLVEVSDHEMRVSATDLNLSIAGAIPADVKTHGSLALNAREFLDRVKQMPEGDIALTTDSDHLLVIRSVGSPRRYTVNTLPAEQFPTLPKSDPGGTNLELDVRSMASLISSTHFSISTDDSRPNLNSALFEWEGDRVRMVTTDGHRLSKMDVQATQQFADTTMLIPLKGILELRRLCDEFPQGGPDAPQLVMTQAGSSAFFQLPGFQLSVKLVDAQFPPYQQVIPERSERVIRVPREAMIEALKAVSIVANDRAGGVRLTFERDRLRFETQSSESGLGFDEIAIEYDGEPLTLGLNARYLIDALGSMDAEEVAVSLSGELDPTVLRPATTDRRQQYLAVIMPIRI